MSAEPDTAISHVRVEYDFAYEGGEDYAGTGNHAFVPLSKVDELGVEGAFTDVTGHDAAHIVHYTLDDIFDAQGNRIEDEPGPVPR